MNVRRNIGVFLSGFIVYGIVSASVGAADRRSSLGRPIPDARADSGSRLKAEYLAGDDGTKDYQLTLAPWVTPNTPYVNAHPVNLYWDSMRSEECFFQTAADGKSRCLPIATLAPLFYADAACTQQHVAINPPPPGCPTNVIKYALLPDPTPPVCPLTTGFPPLHFFPIGNLVAAPSQCYQMSNGTCTSTACPNGAQFAYYAVGAEVDPASFVASTSMKDP